METGIERRLLIVGARDGSLGHAVGVIASRAEHYSRGVYYVDLPDFDITERSHIVKALESHSPTDVVCTAGINLPDGQPGTHMKNAMTMMAVNALGPTALCLEAIDYWMHNMIPIDGGFNFVGVSSNSAHVARSGSAGYCASKAALSASLRSVARSYAGKGVNVWGYEPGWINGTPMSNEVLGRLKPGVKPHRIPGGKGISRDWLAGKIVADLVQSGPALNGVMMRIDGGDQ